MRYNLWADNHRATAVFLFVMRPLKALGSVLWVFRGFGLRNKSFPILDMAQSRLELALILYFAQTYLVLVTLLELGLFIYKVGADG